MQTTKVKIRKLNKKNIDQYLKKSGKQILTSVGCYQIEKSGPQIIEFIKGDYFNVMGLPLFPLINFIKSFVLKVLYLKMKDTMKQFNYLQINYLENIQLKKKLMEFLMILF